MRFEGQIRTWNDDRGFGFIAPAQGGDDVFVHVSAIRARGSRPLLNQRVTFEVERRPDGKKRACRVMCVTSEAARTPVKGRSRRRPSTTSWGGASLFAIPGFLIVYLLAAIVWKVPHLVGIGYLALSAICLVFYAADKFAARSGGWRTREGTLLLLGLLGGWPGALLAQQWLRHKSIKPSFRHAFWLTVIGNVLAFVVLSSPWIAGWNLLR
jgi:uncharacterized membrane protein YsdA (DUF1294 family)/cold shock CspA family protein